MDKDVSFLKQAIEVGNQKTKPYNFGAVVVKDGQAIAAEHGHVQEENNPTLHAEVSAIVSACQKLGAYNIDGCVLYASHEPCMMCMSCAAWAHVDRVVYCIPASEQGAVMYEFKDFSIQDFAKKIPRPLRVEQLNIN